jgi:hypothetical protein
MDVEEDDRTAGKTDVDVPGGGGDALGVFFAVHGTFG